jgi:hypothetical protein
MVGKSTEMGVKIFETVKKICNGFELKKLSISIRTSDIMWGRKKKLRMMITEKDINVYLGKTDFVMHWPMTEEQMNELSKMLSEKKYTAEIIFREV